MFERFTESARRVVVHAQGEARLLRHDHIGTEHLLLGLLHDDTEGAVRVLAQAGLTLENGREAVAEIEGTGERAPGGSIPFAPRAKKVLELSLREALQLGHDYISSEHILLGLVRDGEGAGAKVLQRRGIDPGELRRDLVMALHGRQAPRPRGGFTGPGRLTGIEERLGAIEERLAHIERLLEDGPGPESA